MALAYMVSYSTLGHNIPSKQ